MGCGTAPRPAARRICVWLILYTIKPPLETAAADFPAGEALTHRIGRGRPFVPPALGRRCEPLTGGASVLPDSGITGAVHAGGISGKRLLSVDFPGGRRRGRPFVPPALGRRCEPLTGGASVLPDSGITGAVHAGGISGKRLLSVDFPGGRRRAALFVPPALVWRCEPLTGGASTRLAASGFSEIPSAASGVSF